MPGLLCRCQRPGGVHAADPGENALHVAAELTLAKLAPDLRRSLWVERRWLGCAPGKISARVRERLDLYAAIAARDARGMLARGRALLEQGQSEGGDDGGRYLLHTAILGARAAGEAEEAQRLWRNYGARLYPAGVIPPQVVYLNNL